jgi:photosystem II stability/assembly factor-like uncharacterized protein
MASELHSQVDAPRSASAAARRLPLIAALTCSLAACAPTSATRSAQLGEPRIEEQTSGTAELLQAVSVVDSSVVWVSGHGGTYARTLDGGRRWTTSVVRGADTLEFRDVHAASATTAWLLSAGPGESSRIYRTIDAGATWTLQWVNDEPAGFYDCLDFWDTRRGFVYGDAVEGALRILVTDDGGETWRRVPEGSLPAALPSEGGFAASGTCAVTGADGRAWVAAGNAERARVFRTDDYGRSWQAADAPVVAGEGAGLASITMVDALRGFVFGGHLGDRENTDDKVASTEDGGRTWRAVPGSPIPGAIYGGVHLPDTDGRVFVVVGPGGAAASLDGGVRWSTLDPRPWWGIGSGGPDATWVTGPQGRVARLRVR